MAMTMLLLLSFALVLLDRRGAAVPSYGGCVTPESRNATCTRLSDCKFLYNWLLYEPTTEQREYLKESFCGYYRGTVLICCATPRGFIDTSRRQQIDSTYASSLILKPPACGSAVNDRIYGGNDADIGEFPWVVLLEYTNEQNKLKGYYCGGSLINSRYVLTAAHCVSIKKNSNWRLTAVRLGEWDTSTDPDCQPTPPNTTCGENDYADPYRTVPVDRYIKHLNHVALSRDRLYDIALIRLSNDVKFTHYIRPICLADKFTNYENYTMDVAGWGQTKNSSSSIRKQKAALRVANLGVCKCLYAKHRMPIRSNQMCAGDDGKDACKGDSGSPLMFPFNGEYLTYFAVGIVSYGMSKCGNEMGVYTRVDAYIDWINETMITAETEAVISRSASD